MKIKICGLTSPKEAEYLRTHRIDFAGMILFFPKSKRNLTIPQAREILASLPEGTHSVAVTVCPSLPQVLEIEATGFDYIQIHGSLAPEILAETSIPILKAFNIQDMPEYEQYRQCDRIVGYVFDALEPGSGKAFDWNLVKTLPRDDKLLLLAGGLQPGNVADAIRYLSPDGVDVSSGVEYDDQPGKDPVKIAAFAKAVRDTQK
ncbi:MAG: phosphoribosylanthranilate isomerase [Lachnospiraceae bacterium]|nr:phosphoribosylanthranilate isomerase [Lachnospiraceae bacterium]